MVSRTTKVRPAPKPAANDSPMAPKKPANRAQRAFAGAPRAGKRICTEPTHAVGHRAGHARRQWARTAISDRRHRRFGGWARGARRVVRAHAEGHRHGLRRHHPSASGPHEPLGGAAGQDHEPHSAPGCRRAEGRAGPRLCQPAGRPPGDPARQRCTGWKPRRRRRRICRSTISFARWPWTRRTRRSASFSPARAPTARSA